MKQKINVNIKAFLPTDQIKINSADPYHIGFEWGKATQKLVSKQLQLHHKSISKSKHQSVIKLWENAKNITNSSTCIIDGTNWLERYMSMINGFARGAEIELIDCIYLQTVADAGCQTIFTHDRDERKLAFVHIEENEDDKELAKIQKHLEIVEKSQKKNQKSPIDKLNQVLKKSTEFKYNYRILHIQSNTTNMHVFAYPGLCSLGSTFGFRQDVNLFFSADTLFMNKDFVTNSLWANAVTSMVADTGKIEIAEKLVKKLEQAKIRFFGGYAVHLAKLNSPQKLQSFEIGGESIKLVKPTETGSRKYIAQTNYPKAKKIETQNIFYQSPKNIKSWDVMTAQTSMLLTRRNQYLEKTAKHFNLQGNSDAVLLNLYKLITEQYGDLYITEKIIEPAGFISLYQAGYCIGVIDNNGGNLTIGKLSPHSLDKKKYTRVYKKTDIEKTGLLATNLHELALKLLKRN